MQTKYYLSFEQVGIIRRIPLKEQDPDMQGILDAFIKAFRITNELDDDDTVNTVDLINALNHIDDIYIDTVEIYEDGFEMIEQSIPLGDASKCVSNLLQIVQYNDAFDLAANNLALEIKNSVRFLDDILNAPDDISRLKGLLLEGNAIDHVTVAIKFESGADIKEAIQKHLANDIWETIYDTLVSSKDSITQETIEMLHSNIDAFYKQEVTREVKPFKKKKPSYQS